ncbi:hypothetical protein B0T24DRAFT_494168, partial [Lasiosphaeria ovina]
INPFTGKPYNTTFLRLYDLIRYEHTIHNKPRYVVYNREKTFSRADALTRYYRIYHPNRELLSGKRR